MGKSEKTNNAWMITGSIIFVVFLIVALLGYMIMYKNSGSFVRSAVGTVAISAETAKEAVVSAAETAAIAGSGAVTATVEVAATAKEVGSTAIQGLRNVLERLKRQAGA